MVTVSPLVPSKENSPVAAKRRITSIDMLRGLVMLIMAIDHLRDLLHLGHPEPTDLQTTTPALFFTRYITHFCAPTFVLLSGISALLAGKKRTGNQLAGFLIKRGIWLMAVEVFVINFIASLDAGYHLFVLQVIWAIGCSMVLLGLLVWARLSPAAIGIIGAAIFLGHNIIDVLHNKTINSNFAWRLLLSSDGFSKVDTLPSGRLLIVAYAYLPWAGVMMMGYWLGTLYLQAAQKRKRILKNIGLTLLVLFVVLRAFNVYGDPAPWFEQKSGMLTVLSFLNVTKYPCSLLYLCLTLGTALLILAYSENAGNRISRILMVYGNVPFFYYVLHWALAQAITVTLFFATGHHLADKNPDIGGFPFSPNNFGLPLGGVYLVWILMVTVLYFPCRWFGQYKSTHRQWWLSYL